MASGSAELRLKIQADFQEAKTALEQINSAVAGLSTSSQLTATSLRQVDSNLTAVKSAALGAITAFLSLRTAMEAIQMADDYNQLASRIKMVASSTEEYEMVQRRLMEVSDRTYKPLAQQQELFIRSSSSMRELGYSTEETLNFIDSISSSLTINSASAERSQLAISALSKSMTTGKVAAQEWETVMNVIPTIASDIATYLRETGKDATATEQSVKNMAKEGQISMELFAGAAMNARQRNAELAENMPTTMGDAMTKLKNHLSAYIAGVDDMTATSNKLVIAINFITEHLDTFIKIIGTIATGAIARYTVSISQNIISTIKAGIAKKALIAQELALAKAQYDATSMALLEAKGHAQAAIAAKAHQAALVQLNAAQKAASASMMLGLGLPGLAMTIASVAAGWLLFRNNTNEASTSLDRFGRSAEEAKQKLKEMTTEQAAKGMLDLNNQIKSQADRLEDAKNKARSYIDLLVEGSYREVDTGIMTPERATEIQSLLYKVRKAIDDNGKGVEEQLQKIEKLDSSYQHTVNTLRNHADAVSTQASELNKINETFNVYKERVDGDTEATEKNNQAKREFISAASSLKDEIKKLTGSINSNINSARTSADVISILDMQLTNLKKTAGAAPDKINEITKALDKLKEKQQQLDNITNTKYIDNLKKQTETVGMSAADKQRYDVKNNKTMTPEQKKVALSLIAQGEAQEKATQSQQKAKSAADSLAKSNLSYVEGLEKQSATLNLSKVATLEYEISQKKLTGALLERANAAKQALVEQQNLNNAKVNTGMQVELLRLNGHDLQANLLEIQNEFKQTTANLEKEGNTAGIAIAKQLFNAQVIKTQLDSVQNQVEQYFTNMRLREQSIQAQVQAGQISEYEGQKRLTALHKETAATVKKAIPELEKMAQMPGAMGEQTRNYLTEIQTQLLVLETTTSELENAFRNGLQEGMQSSIDSLVKGTMDLNEAVKNLFETIASNMLNQAVQNVTSPITDYLFSGLKSVGGMFGMPSEDSETQSPQAIAISSASEQGALAMQAGIEQGGEIAAQTMASAISSMGSIGQIGGEKGLFEDVASHSQEAIAGIQKVQAAKTAADTSMAASAASATASTTATTTAAATAATTAWTPAAAASSVASFGSAAAIGLAALMMVLTAAKAFKTGGEVTGAGTGTSDSIPAWLSNGEFVTRASVMRQRGAKQFAHLFNRHGMAALDMIRVRHATGGVAGIPAPNLPSPTYAAMKPIDNKSSANSSTTLKNNQNFYLIDDPKKAGNAILNNSHTQQSYLLWMQENSQQIKSALEIG